MSSVRQRVFSTSLSMALALFVGMAVLPSTAQASVSYFNSGGTSVTSLTLQDLLNGGHIDVNNGFDTKRFDGFANFTSAGTAGGVAAGDISVTGIDTGGLNPGPGLVFQGNFEAGAGGLTQDTRFDYNVSIVQPSGFLIEDIGLKLGAAFVGTDGGQVKIIESGENPVGTPVSGVMVFEKNSAGNITGDTADVSFFAPVTFVHVQKDVFLKGGTTQATSITDFTQQFSQVAVPEPSSLAIAGIGALSLVGYGVRRRLKK